MFTKDNIKKAFTMSIPLIIGFIPLAFICGVFLQGVGLNFFQVFLMSTLVFAGSSQFVAASMIGSGASVFSIVVTTFIINIRHLLYGSSLSKYIKTKSLPKLLIISQFLSDELYAINYELYEEGNWNDDLNIIFSLISASYWIFGSVLGGLLGDIANIPIDIASFSLVAMFIMLMVLQCNSRIKIIVCITTAFVATGIIYFYKGSFNIIISSLVCASLGYFLDKKEEEPHDK